MKIALCQINTIIGDIQGNKEKILNGYRAAQSFGADLALFPELSLLGYPPLDLVEKKGFRDKVYSAVNEIAEQTNEAGLLFGALMEDNDSIGTNIYNSAILCFDKKIQFIQHKTLIPNYDVFDEMRYFEPAKSIDVIEFKGERLGISICEDIWNDKDYWKHRLYEHDPVEQLIEKGATIIVNISASPYSFGKREERKEMLSALSARRKVPIAYCCAVGAQTELIFDGASMCFNAQGELTKLGKAYEEETILFDTDQTYTPIQKVENCFEEEVLKALQLGIKDYFGKLRFKKAIIGLSGGIDSALVTYLAVSVLGKENVRVVLMPSKYSSAGSIDDSIKLINKLGIPFDTIDIQSGVDSSLLALQPCFEGKAEDVTEENIQSRIRGMYLMALSNKHGYLVLTTGNKSELATGYCTLYGDMCGGLAVIADVYKTDIYRLANYINRDEEILPKEIITKAPSAELRLNQTDQDSLPPYPLLDRILRMYLEENKEQDEIIAEIKDELTVKRVLKLVDINEFKRKQAAPALRVSYKAFGYGRRYPIVQRWR